MFRNYFKTALRNMMKRKGYSLLNIAGLTIGMTCCLLIFHYVSYEKSYDRFNPEAGQTVRVRLDSYQQGKLAWKSSTSYPAIGPTMKKDYPEVVNFCRLLDAEGLFTNETTNIKFTERKGYYADPSSIDMINVQLLAGNKASVLNAPDKMVISETMAKKYFGNEHPLGKRLTAYLEGKVRAMEITGVMRDYPANSHLDIKYLISYVTRGEINKLYGDKDNAVETSFGWYDFYTYLQLRPGADLQQLENKLPAFCKKYLDNPEQGRPGNRSELHLIPLTDIHLYSNYNQEAEVNGNGQTVGFLFLVAIFIIGIAWINYINLATARSVERAREVGVRKVMGAARGHLIKQFLVESLLFNFIALFFSLVLFFLLMPSFENFVGSPHTSISLTAHYWRLFVALFLVGTLLSGLYPAFVLSGFQPITVLKGMFKSSSGGLLLRKGLIIVQFITSVVLIAGTIIVYQQVSYMRGQQLGAKIDQTIILEGPASITDSLYRNAFQPFKSTILQQHKVKSITASSNVMGQEIYWCSTFRSLQQTDKERATIYIMGIDENFIPSFDLQLAAGRNFSKEFGTDNKAVILNESATQLLGFESAAAALGGKIPGGRDTMTVVGVIKNYHHQGLQKAIEPLLMRYIPDQHTYYSLKVAAADMPGTIAQLEKTWNNYFPSDPFSYTFLDESFAQQYKADILFGKVFGVFAFLAILIACFGLLGLSAYNVLQRTKEIGVRKILGASSQNILLLLSRDFLKLVIISFVCAIPICWYIMHQWLQDFAYRIDISWWVFVLAGCLALLIAWATIVLQSLRAVVENPVKNLRTE